MANPGQAEHTFFATHMDRRAKALFLGSLMVTMFLAALDQTVVATATPRIVADLEGFSLYSWLFTSYMLTSTVVIPIVGKLGDLFGRKWVLLVGVSVFIVASALCGAAWSMESLIAFRFLQGLGGGAIFACVFALTGDAFPPIERGKYIGLFTGVFSLASILGPTLGGFLTDNGGWRWIFYMNVPVALVAIPSIYMNIPTIRRPVVHGAVRIDWLGAITLAVASVLFLLAFVWAGDKYAWGSPQIVGLLGGAAALAAIFVMLERRHPDPMIPLHLFRNRVFTLSNLIVFVFGFGVFGAFQYLGLFVQAALNASATASGVVTTPQSLATLITSIFAGQVISRTGRYKWTTVGGTIFIAAAMALMQLLDTNIAKIQIMATVFVLGLGFGLVMPPLSMIAQNVVAPQFIGVASGVNQFSRQIGAVMGVAVFGAILTNTYRSEFEQRFTAEQRAVVPPAIVERLEDPTLPLNKKEFAVIERQILALPGGQALLDGAHEAQAEGIAFGTRMIYLAALIAAVANIALALIMREVPLRRPGAIRATAPAAPAEGGGPPPVVRPESAPGTGTPGS